MSDDALLQARGIRWTADGRLIVADIDLEVADGSIVGLLGPNGSGKTTLLRAVARLIAPDAGAVRLGGEDVGSMRRRQLAQRLAFVEQHAITSLDLRVADVVLLGRSPYRSALAGDSAEDIELARHALGQVDMTGTEQRRWHTLSGGEQQRVQLARALTQQPTLLVLDEPTNHLDVGHQLQLLHYVKGIGITTLAALHDVNLAAMFCDSIIVLHRGRVAAAGAVSDVITSKLLSDVFAVTADVIPHPHTGRPHVILHPPTDGRASTTSAAP